MKYIVLKAIGEGGTHYPRGSEVELDPTRAAAIGIGEYLEEVGATAVKAEHAQAEATDDLASLKLSELRKIAKQYGIDDTGSKTDLVERITLHKETLSA